MSDVSEGLRETGQSQLQKVQGWMEHVQTVGIENSEKSLSGPQQMGDMKTG
jgi:hypothetical protein